MVTHQTQEKQEQKLPKWLIAVIAILIFFMAAQTGAFIYYVMHNQKTQERQLAVRHRAMMPKPMGVAPSATPSAVTASRQAWQDPWDEDPFVTMRRLQGRMGQMLENLSTYTAPLAQRLQAGAFDFMPSVDLEETDNAYVVRADLPGIERDKVNVTVRGNLLTIQGVRESGTTTNEEDQGYYAQERSYGSFARTITLPGPVDEANVKATYEDGVLNITLPKTSEEKSMKKIAVQ